METGSVRPRVWDRLSDVRRLISWIRSDARIYPAVHANDMAWQSGPPLEDPNPSSNEQQLSREEEAHRGGEVVADVIRLHSLYLDSTYISRELNIPLSDVNRILEENQLPSSESSVAEDPPCYECTINEDPPPRYEPPPCYEIAIRVKVVDNKTV